MKKYVWFYSEKKCLCIFIIHTRRGFRDFLIAEIEASGVDIDMCIKVIF